jgi:quinol monooxygenase YgiN
MGINIINELKTKAGRSEDLIALLRELLPSSLEHGGAEEISIRQDQDDPTYIISVQRWESREAYLAYFAWRTEHGVAAQIRELLEEPQRIRFFNEVLYGVPSAGSPPSTGCRPANT